MSGVRNQPHGPVTQNLTGFTQGHFPLGSPIGNVDDNQLWGADWGILR